MKTIFASFFVMICSFAVMAQAPQAFNYQGIARDASGTPLANQHISLRISILQGVTTVFQEHHDINTSKLGVFSIEIGNGTNPSGQFENINWGNGDHFIRTEIDPDGGTSFTLLGESQLLSVPYALFAGNGGGSLDYWDKLGSSVYYNTGNVGIGTTTPDRKLTIVGDDPILGDRIYIDLHNKSTSNRSIVMMNLRAGLSGGTTSLQHLANTYDFDGDTYTDFGVLSSTGRGVILSADNPDGALKFMTKFTETYPVERMRITNEGNVGIGTTNPLSKLSILGNDPVGDARNYLDIRNLSLSNRSIAWMQVAAGSSNTFTSLQHCSETYDFDLDKYTDFGQVVSTGRGLIVRASGEEGIIKFLLGQNEINSSEERMRLTTDGNLGIGTESPASRLQVTDGDIYIEDINKGVIMKSPDGSCWRMTINNDGSIKTTSISCPN